VQFLRKIKTAVTAVSLSLPVTTPANGGETTDDDGFGLRTGTGGGGFSPTFSADFKQKINNMYMEPDI